MRVAATLPSVTGYVTSYVTGVMTGVVTGVDPSLETPFEFGGDNSPPLFCRREQGGRSGTRGCWDLSMLSQARLVAAFDDTFHHLRMPAAALPGLDAALVQRMLDDAGRSALGADLGLIERLRSDLGGIRHWLRNVLLKPNLPFCLPLIPLVTGWSRPRNGKRSARRGASACPTRQGCREV